MLPKVIHYCWFGRGKKTELMERCIASWRKFLPDYEIKEWNEDNYDVNAIPFTQEAYQEKKYAFVSDYARFEILYRFGGVYFDTDVEIIKPIDDILDQGGYMGLESELEKNKDGSLKPMQGIPVAPGLGMATMARHDLFRSVCEAYRRQRFRLADGHLNTKPVGFYVSDYLLENGFILKDEIVDFRGIKIYPAAYFNPMPTRPRRLRLKPETRTIHHYTSSWHSRRDWVAIYANDYLGKWGARIVSLLMHNPIYMLKRVRTFIKTGR